MLPRHQRFIREYTRDYNATAAYKRAGYRATGRSAEVNASRLRRQPVVATAIEMVLSGQLEEVRQRARE